ncbi:hypothetical protein HPP92_009485 [Vanilla planifolia]|uniref:Uncharacterized protein n=1 Tax=Vanilla planifolia TaxID=51239 RepID=A0A835V885_VANPL|nr:hypothetical protein HPP92_009485 [Vanilla planifolia]
MGPLENGDFEEDPGGRVPGAAWGRSTIPAGRPIAIEVVRSGQRQSGTDPGRPHGCGDLQRSPHVRTSSGQLNVSVHRRRLTRPSICRRSTAWGGTPTPWAFRAGNAAGDGETIEVIHESGRNRMCDYKQYGGQWNLEEGPWMFVQGCSTRLYSLPTNLDEDLLPPGWIMGQSGGPVTSTPTTIQSPQGRRAIELLSGKESSSQMVETKPEEAIQPSLCHGLCRRLLPTSPGCRSAAGDQAQGFHFTPIGTRPPLLPTSASSPGREDSGGILQCVTTTHEGDDHSSLYAVQWWTTSRFGVSIAATMVEDWL